MENFITAERARRITDEALEGRWSLESIIEDIDQCINDSCRIGCSYVFAKTVKNHYNSLEKYLNDKGFRVEPLENQIDNYKGKF
jgi:hypothetical protein